MKLQLLPSVLCTAYYYWRLQSLDLRSWQQLAAEPEFQNARVAVVGNAGYLSEMQQGDVIDSHDIILRMNNFRTAGYEEQVGSRTDIFMTTFHSDVNLRNPELTQAKWIVSSMPVNFVKSVGVGLQQRHGDFITAGMLHLGRRIVFAPQTRTFLDIRSQIGSYPTTGGMAIALAVKYLLPVCQSIYFTGFSFFQGRAHYFSDREGRTANHNLHRERQWISNLLSPHIATQRLLLDSRLEAFLQEPVLADLPT